MRYTIKTQLNLIKLSRIINHVHLTCTVVRITSKQERAYVHKPLYIYRL